MGSTRKQTTASRKVRGKQKKKKELSCPARSQQLETVTSKLRPPKFTISSCEVAGDHQHTLTGWHKKLGDGQRKKSTSYKSSRFVWACGSSWPVRNGQHWNSPKQESGFCFCWVFGFLWGVGTGGWKLAFVRREARKRQSLRGMHKFGGFTN